jgi:hypothetical protein
VSESASDFVDDIIPSKAPEHIEVLALSRMDFAPWHRVHKQYIREFQWNYHVANVVKRYLSDDLQTDEAEWAFDSEGASDDKTVEVPENILVERPLRCLVIPGNDLLDMRSMLDKLQELKCWIKFLGFNSSMRAEHNRAQVHVALNDVTSRNRVFKGSYVMPDSFQAIGSEKSQAHNKLCEYGPYEVVNLDICDTLLPHHDEEKIKSYYTAIHSLIKYQNKEQTKPWLLFLTTQIDHTNANQKGMNKLGSPFRTNCDAHPSFAERLQTLIPKKAFTSGNETIDLSALNPAELERVFGVILGKYFISMLSQATPIWSVHMLSAYRYVVEPSEGIPLVSLAFIFTPQHNPPVDKSGMSDLKTNVKVPPSELDLALKLITTAGKIQDVDQILRERSDLHEQLKNSSADLLAKAGYNREEYLKWVNDGEITSKR